MNTDKQQAREITTMVEDSLLQFQEAIKTQAEQNLQISRTTSHMIRYVLVIITILSIGIIFLTWSQKNDMRKMSEYMQGMTKDVSVMSNAIVKMQTSMSTVEGGINTIAAHAQSISSSIRQKDNLTATLSHIANTVELMQRDAQGLGTSMENVNYNLGTINKQMKSLNRKLGAMGQDVNRMPSPTKMFPF